MPVTQYLLASEEAAAGDADVRGQQGSAGLCPAGPHPAAAQPHAMLEQEPGIRHSVGIKPTWILPAARLGCWGWHAAPEQL